MAQKKLMTAKQIQKFLQISNNTLRAYVDKGLIGMWQPGGKNCTVRYYIIENGDKQWDSIANGRSARIQ